MNAYQKLFKNSIIYAIANIGSKLLTFLLVPFYTYVLSTSEYGTIDMIMTTTALFLPIITLSIYDATLRFTVNTKIENERSYIFSSSLILVILGNIIFLLFYPIMNKIGMFQEYLYLFYIVIFLQGIYSVISQFIRAIGNVKTFAISGIISTFIMLVLNILLLAKFRMGIRGYLYSIIISNIITIFFMITSSKVWIYFKVSYWDREIVKKMLIFSIPLIPNTLMWWIMNVSDRYVIAMFMGESSIGIYAIANKIPSILNLLNTIFFQAWQISAIEEDNSEYKSQFYTNIFSIYSSIMLISASFILVFIKPVVTNLLSTSFSEVWRYVPFLLLASVFSSFSTFLGANYIAMKKTKNVFITSVYGGLINILLNFVLIKQFGLNGTTFATMMSFFVVWILRVVDTKNFTGLKINIKKVASTIIIVLLQILIVINDYKYSISVQSILFILILTLNMKELKYMLVKVLKKLKNIYYFRKA